MNDLEEKKNKLLYEWYLTKAIYKMYNITKVAGIIINSLLPLRLTFRFHHFSRIA
jgi:hypothetical protein